MSVYLGDYLEDATIYHEFTTNDGSGGRVEPSTAFEAADLVIYKNGSATEKATTNGITMTSPFDAKVGVQAIQIDTSNDTGDAGFWVAGADYTVLLYPDETVDSQNISKVLFKFSIENRSGSINSTATSNLEKQYDTTGLSGDTFPATQAQLGSITNSGSAVNKTASSYSLTTGTQSSGTYTSTFALDGTRHEHTDSAGSMDLYYEFLIGSGSPTSVTFDGYLNGNNDSLEVYGYDWVSAGWVQIGTLVGKAASTNETDTYQLTTTMVGTGSDLGKVRVRFTDGAFTLTTATLAVDRLLLSFNQVSGGYSEGIEVDTNASNTNTVPGFDGVKGNPVSTWAAAVTLSNSTGITDFHIINGSSITLSSNSSNYTLKGENWTLALGGQSIDGAYFAGATSITGTGTNGSNKPWFTNCTFGTCTLPVFQASHCCIAGDITVSEAGDIFVVDSHSSVAGTATPSIDLGVAVGSSNISFRNYSGGIEMKNMGQLGTDTMSLEGRGQLVLNANCAGGTISIRGLFTVTDNSGSVTLSDNARFDWSKTFAEPGQGTPAATASIATKIGYVYKAFRNKSIQTNSVWQLLNDAQDTVDQTRTVGDSSGTFNRGEITSG